MRYCVFLLLCLLVGDAPARADIIRSVFLSEPIYASKKEGDALSSDTKSKPFRMSGELGVIYADGNTTGSTFTGKINAKHNFDNWYTKYTANLLYKQNVQVVDENRERVTSAQSVFFSGQGDYKLNNPEHRVFVYGEYDDDRFNQYQYQAALAVGWTEQLWANDESELTYSIGPGYARSIPKSDSELPTQAGIIVRAAMEYEKHFNEMATFRQFVSTETDEDFSRSVSETSLSAKINGSLAMKLSINMTHNRSSVALEEPLDTQTSVTLVYQFF